MKLLYCSANVRSQVQLDLEGSFDRIRSGLESVNAMWTLRGVSELDLDKLGLELARLPRANILHFDCHGARNGGLWLRQPEYPFELEADPGGLIDMLAPQTPELRLVVLLACNTDRLGEQLGRRIGAAIAVEGPIVDVAGSPFSRVLYTHLALGRPLSSAFATALGRLRAQYAAHLPLGLRLFPENAEIEGNQEPPDRLQIVVETQSSSEAILVTRTPSQPQPRESRVEGRVRRPVSADSTVVVRIDAGRVVLKVHAPVESELVGQPATVVLDGEVVSIPTLQPLPSQFLGDEQPCILDLRLERPI